MDLDFAIDLILSDIISILSSMSSDIDFNFKWLLCAQECSSPGISKLGKDSSAT